ncbi:MAG: hypothetical protein ABJA64_03390, partial [Candidatus Saccharibacteria bacterium]
MTEIYINQKSTSWRSNIVSEMAMNWETVAMRLDVNTSTVRNQLHGGATPFDCSSKLMEILCNKMVTLETLRIALINSGLNRIAAMITADRTSSETFGQFKVRLYNLLTTNDKQVILMCAGVPAGRASDLSSSGITGFLAEITNRGYFSVDGIDLSIWLTLPLCVSEIQTFANHNGIALRNSLTSAPIQPLFIQQVNIPPVHLPPVQQPNDDDLFAQALANQRRASKALTLAEFIESDQLTHFCLKLCMATDESCLFPNLLTELGLAAAPGMSKFVSDIKSKWLSDRSGKPTLTILQKLIKSPDYAQMPIETMFKTFEKLKKKEINAVIAEYRRHRDGKERDTSSRTNAAFEAEDDMRQFLLTSGYSKQEEVDEDLAILTRDGAESVHDLADVTLADLQQAYGAKYKVFKAKKLIKALKGVVVTDTKT